VAALAVAVGLFTRFSFDDGLSRDEAIYAYGAQQFAEGRPPYVSIFDPKTPFADMAGGAAVAIGRALPGTQNGLDDLHAIRALFFVFACLTVLAVFVLAAWLFASPLGGLASAVVLASFQGFALDAAGGPDAKTPGILFAVAAMALLVKRRYFWAGLAGALAFLVWQPLLIYAALAVLVAALTSPAGERARGSGAALLGAAIPVVATAVYFLAKRALGDFVDAAFVFPATDLKRTPESWTERFFRIGDVVEDDYGRTGRLFWIGLALLALLILVGVARRRRDFLALVGEDPLLHVVLASFIPVAAYSIYDFQGYPDLYPGLPYAALGFGGAIASLRLVESDSLRRVAVTAALVALAGLVAFAAHTFSAVDARRNRALDLQLDIDRRVGELLRAGETLEALGNSRPLVLLQRRSPDPYIYLSSGVDSWAADHLGGLSGWVDRLRAAHPAAITVGGPWHDSYSLGIERRLEQHYVRVRVGARVVIFVPERLRAEAEELRYEAPPPAS
jgi:hypothetical protein